MIDLRFVKRKLRTKTSPHGKDQFQKVLQFRSVMNPSEIGLQEPIWSEWSDVRLEEELKPEKAANKNVDSAT